LPRSEVTGNPATGNDTHAPTARPDRPAAPALTRDTGHGTRETGHGTRTRDTVHGTRDNLNPYSGAYIRFGHSSLRTERHNIVLNVLRALFIFLITGVTLIYILTYQVSMLLEGNRTDVQLDPVLLMPASAVGSALLVVGLDIYLREKKLAAL